MALYHLQSKSKLPNLAIKSLQNFIPAPHLPTHCACTIPGHFPFPTWDLGMPVSVPMLKPFPSSWIALSTLSSNIKRLSLKVNPNVLQEAFHELTSELPEHFVNYSLGCALLYMVTIYTLPPWDSRHLKKVL